MFKRSICFLLGSGISMHAGVPGTRALSEELLFGDGIIREQSKNFVPYDDQNPTHKIHGLDQRDGVREVLPLVAALKAEADIHYQGWQISNYEDWYYLADQLGKGSIDYDNPACSAFREILRPRIERKHALSSHVIGIDVLGDQVCKYISDIIWRRLHAAPPKRVHLDWIVDAARDEEFQNQGLFTLNHDTLLEDVFEKRGEPYTVGFDKSVPGSTMLHWDEDSFLEKSGKTLIGKLHGSVDWLELNNLGEFKRNDQRRMDAFRRKPGDQAPDGSTLMMLLGRHNKLYHYSSFVYDVLQIALHRALKAADVLVVCGYGWGDKGINTKLIQWRFKNAKKLVVIRKNDPFPESARQAVFLGFSDWREDQRFLHISANAEEMTWERIKDELNKGRLASQ